MSGAADFFKRLQSNMPAMEREMAQTIIAVESENFHAMNFRREGFTDKGFQKWKARKTPLTPRRSLLVKTSVMKGHALKGEVRGDKVDFRFPLDYMKVHNEGGRAGRGNGFTMPKRQFIGESDYLKQQIKRKAITFLNRKLKNL